MQITLDQLNARSPGRLPGLLGIEFTQLEQGRICCRLTVRPELLAPNGYLHAGTVVAMADTCCGYGTISHLPPGANLFTTIELKTNFLGTALEGVIECEATLAHGGRTTQIWDAVVRDPAQDRTLALFRCTQLILYPRAG
jgi:uncharacterized protein (TIGR00369 family)